MKMYSIKKSKSRGVWILWLDVERERSYGCINLHEDYTKKDLMKYVHDNKIILNRWVNK